MPREKTSARKTPDSLGGGASRPLLPAASANSEVAALVSELEAKWTDPLEGKPHGRKLSREAAIEIVRRVGEGLELGRVLAPWRITPENLALYAAKADEGTEPYATFFHFLARAQNVLRGQLLTAIANSGDVKAKIELLRATTPEFAPEPAETVFNLRPQFRGAIEGGKTIVNVLPELPPYEPPQAEKEKP